MVRACRALPAVLALGFLACEVAPAAGQQGAVDEIPAAGQVASLQEELENGLRAWRPQEFAFIAVVVGMVEGGQLPLSLVKGTFKWAIRKHSNYPFPYFERALRLRAARRGIEID